MASGTAATVRSVGAAIKDSPATQQLRDDLKEYLQARGNRLVGRLSSTVAGMASKLEDAADNGGVLAAATKAGGLKMAEGASPGQAALTALATGAKEKIKSLFGKGKSTGGKAKSMNIIEDIDVGVPVSVAYDQWTQFEEFSSFMRGVESVEQRDEIESTWRIKIAKSRRTLKGTVTEQIPDRRIVWTTEGAKGSVKGVVTFHPLGDDLTRILLVLEYFPSGLIEKTGNLWRTAGRRARLDLKHFRRFVTMRAEATGSWRGEIRDGEVVRAPDDEAMDEDQYEDADEVRDVDEEADVADEEEQPDDDAARDADEEEPDDDAARDADEEEDWEDEEELEGEESEDSRTPAHARG